MSIPDYIKTEWRSKGLTCLQFSSSDCHSCLANWNKKKYKSNSLSNYCIHSNEVKCYISTFNAWEYKQGDSDIYDCYQEEALSDDNLKQITEIDCPISLSKEVWMKWLDYWNQWKDIYVHLSWVKRFRNYSDDQTIQCSGIAWALKHAKSLDSEVSKTNSCGQEQLNEFSTSTKEIKFEQHDSKENISFSNHPTEVHKAEGKHNEGTTEGKSRNIQQIISTTSNSQVKYSPYTLLSQYALHFVQSLCCFLYKGISNLVCALLGGVLFSNQWFWRSSNNSIFDFIWNKIEGKSIFEIKMAKTEKNCVQYIKNVFHPHLKNVSTANDHLSNNLHITKVGKSGDDRESEKELVRISSSTEEQRLRIAYLTDEDLYSDVQTLNWHNKIDMTLEGYNLMRFWKDQLSTGPAYLSSDTLKYWYQRYRLFLRYDEGVKLDCESWYSVTPEIISAHQAQRLMCDVVVDAFCGAGGNAIQLAMTCNQVIAVDIDPVKIEIARHNAKVYGVEDRIEFIQANFFDVVSKLKADCILLSPPWGGINYLGGSSYNILTLGGQMDGKKLYEAASYITNNIALYLPKNSNFFQITELALLFDPANPRVDIEYSYISNKLKSLTAYFGNLVDYK